MKLAGLFALILAAVTAHAQFNVNAVHTDTNAAPMAADADPSFEVASIRPDTSENRASFSILHIDGQHYSATHVSVLDLLKFANRMQEKQILNLPNWADEKTYNITAVMSPEGRPSFDQVRVMIQKLLADRFQLKTHNEQRTMNVYTLSVVKPGLLKVNTTTPASTRDSEHPVQGGFEFTLIDSPITGYANYLQQALTDRPIVNKTGLDPNVRYDFDVKFLPDETMFGGRYRPSPEVLANPEPNFYTAIQEQLGLKLTPEKAPADVIVVDHIAEPSEN